MMSRGISFRSALLALALAAGAALAAALLAGAARPASRPAGLIAFARADGIYVMHPDGSHVRAVRRGIHPRGIHWSPNGRRLAFIDDGGLYTMNADGTGLALLVAEPTGEDTSAVRWLHSASWLPGGRRIAFTASRGSDRDIWLVDSDGSHLRRFARTPRLWEWEVDWSPAGNRIAFTSDLYFGHLYVMNANGKNLRVLNRGSTHVAFMPEWSPDGRRLAFMGGLPPEAEIWVANATGTLLVRLTHNRVIDSDPVWSRDGRWIAFVRGGRADSLFVPLDKPSSAELYVMNASGKRATRLTRNELGEGSPAWQPPARPRSRGRAASHIRPLAKPLDLVWISDSVGLYTAPHYAFRIRRDLGVRVRVHDEWQMSLSADLVLARLRKPSHPWVRLIRNAEVIFVSGNPAGLVSDECVMRLEPPIDTRPQVWTKYVATLKAIYKRIFAIRKGRPVILRTNNWYVPVIYHAPPAWSGFPPVSWQQAGVLEPCTKRWEQFSAAIARAAGAYSVPVADLYGAFNGKSHLEDPVAKGYIQGDVTHINNRGRKVFVRTLAALGYKRVAPPR